MNETTPPGGDEEELRDLSSEDAQELRNFQDKRRWFEAKLKLLEELAPTYPFILPSLVPSEEDSSVYVYAGKEASSYCLPSAETLRIWQIERDALEEEVLAFDGGDLGRMKEKTREVTLVPLTKPSTHAVAITLDLILLIDRLLTLLRRRFDLLELVALRLQWDNSRWKVMLECRQLKEDVRAFVDADGKVEIPRHERSTSLAGAGNQANDTSSEKKPTPSRSGSDSTSPLITPIRPRHSMTSSPSSPTALFSPHAMSSRPQSFSSTLSIRHRTLVSTHLKRSSAVLDKMIDIAGPLKDLGGLHGPLPSISEEKEGGALPEELLDVQDELETTCEDVKGRIKWCRELEEQREFAERHLTALTGSRDKAEKVISQLKESLSGPASSTQHAALARLLREVEMSVPSPIERTLPRPRHSDYPQVESSTATLLLTLRNGQNGTKELLDISSDGVGWYGCLSTARTKMEEEDKQLSALTEDLPDLLDKLFLKEPSDVSTGFINQEEWLEITPSRISDLVERLPVITRQAQLCEIATMRYKSAYLPPLTLKQMLGEIPFPDSLHEAAAARAEAALGVLRKAEEVIRKAREDVEILPLEYNLEKKVSDLEVELDGLQARVERNIAASIWTNSQLTLIGQGEDQSESSAVKESLKSCRELYDTVLVHSTRLAVMRKTSGRGGDGIGKCHTKLGESLHHLTSRMDLLERVSAQRQTVQEIEREADQLVKRLEHFACGGSATKLDNEQVADQASAEEPNLSELGREIRGWVGCLAERVPFVSSKSTTDMAISPSAPRIPQSNGKQPQLNGSSPDVTLLDERVRLHVNDISTRVSTSLDAAVRQQNNETVSSTHISDSPASQFTSPPPSPPTSSKEEDVFGSREPQLRASSSGTSLRKSKNGGEETSSTLSRIRSLRKQVRSLRLQDLVFPSSSTTLRTPTLHRVPDSNSVNSVLQTLQVVDESMGPLPGKAANGDGADIESELKRLQDDLGSAKAFIPRLEALAAFSDRTKACDEVFGGLMALLDTKGEGLADGAPNGEIAEGEEVLRNAEEAAMAVETDRRVLSDLKRIRAVWADLSASLRPSPSDDTEAHNDTSSIASSENLTPSSSTSPYISRIPIPVSKPRLNSSMSIRSNLSSTALGMRTTSNPFPRLAATTESYRNRTVSTSEEGQRRRVESTSSRSSLTGSTSRSTLRVASGSSTPLARGLANTDGTGATPSRIPRLATTSPSVRTSTPSNDQNGVSRIRKTSMPTRFPSSTSKPRPTNTARRVSDEKVYQSDPKSTLDQAVGKIVNKLKMSVPIVPVNIAGTDEWKDQSGRYWIGAHGRAKLCFCRILRSRTVMVRVGGGWMELSRFLMDHFADALWPATIEEAGGSASMSVPVTPHRNGRPSSSLMSTGETNRIEPLRTALPNGSSNKSETPATDSPSETKTPVPAAHLVLSPQGDASPITPIRKPHISRSISGSTSIPRQSHISRSSSINQTSSFYSPVHATMTPNQSMGESGSGPSSPLVPLHFLKKASESPPVREKEKQRIGLGRRSILGKEGG